MARYRGSQQFLVMHSIPAVSLEIRSRTGSLQEMAGKVAASPGGIVAANRGNRGFRRGTVGGKCDDVSPAVFDDSSLHSA